MLSFVCVAFMYVYDFVRVSACKKAIVYKTVILIILIFISSFFFFLGSNGGVCDRATFTCTCTREWSGAACDQPVCNNGAGCSSQGSCIISALDSTRLCNCTTGWTGPACDTAVCARNSAGVECSGRGMCQTSSGVPTCVCFADFTGVACETTAAQAFSAAPTAVSTQPPAFTNAQGN